MTSFLIWPIALALFRTGSGSVGQSFLRCGLLFWLWIGMMLGAAWIARPRSQGLRGFERAVAAVVLEESLLGPLCFCAAAGVFLPRVGLQALLWLAGGGLVLMLLLRSPLPESLFPVRGRWLRSLLAALALAGLAQVSPLGMLALAALGEFFSRPGDAGLELIPCFLPVFAGLAAWLLLLCLSGRFLVERTLSVRPPEALA